MLFQGFELILKYTNICRSYKIEWTDQQTFTEHGENTVTDLEIRGIITG